MRLGVSVAVVLVGLGRAAAAAATADGSVGDGRAADAGVAPEVRRVQARLKVTGTLTDGQGRPQRGVTVFAEEEDSRTVSALAVSDEAGVVQLNVPPTTHRFGVVSGRVEVATFAHTGPLAFAMTVRPRAGSRLLVPEQKPKGVPFAVERAEVVRGRTVDETGAPVAGVQVWLVRNGVAAAEATTARDGSFVLPATGGKYEIVAHAPSLRLARVKRDGRTVVLTMAVATAVEEVVVHEGHVLRFRLEDSVDPEYYPPPQVRAWLCFSYGIKVSAAPMTAAERRAQKKYWYLDVLRTAPRPQSAWNLQGCLPPDSQAPDPVRSTRPRSESRESIEPRQY